MDDAKICDRCGDYYPSDGDRELHLTDTALAQVTVDLEASRQNPNVPKPGETNRLLKTSRTISRTGRVPVKDLCGECYDALLAFWEGDDDV
jgi:hypothetical protein